MNPKQVYYALIGLIILLIGAVFGGTYEVNNLLSHKSQQLVSLKAKVAALSQEQVNLATAKKDINKYASLYNITQSIVPENKDQAETVRQIVNLAANNNIDLASITFPASTLGGTTTASGTTSVNVNSTSNTLSQLIAVPNIPGVYDMQLIVSSATDPGDLTTYSQLINFLQALENNRLTALVSSLNVVPNSQDPSQLSFSLTMDVYIKPGK